MFFLEKKAFKCLLPPCSSVLKARELQMQQTLFLQAQFTAFNFSIPYVNRIRSKIISSIFYQQRDYFINKSEEKDDESNTWCVSSFLSLLHGHHHNNTQKPSPSTQPRRSPGSPVTCMNQSPESDNPFCESFLWPPH